MQATLKMLLKPQNLSNSVLNLQRVGIKGIKQNNLMEENTNEEAVEETPTCTECGQNAPEKEEEKEEAEETEAE